MTKLARPSLSQGIEHGIECTETKLRRAEQEDKRTLKYDTRILESAQTGRMLQFLTGCRCSTAASE